MSLDFLQSRKLAARGAVGHVTSDTPIAIRLKVKTKAGAVTSITTTTGTGIVIITANGATDTYLFSSYATVGAVADAINADGYVEAKVLDTLRSYDSDDSFVDGAITIGSEGYYDVLVDTSTALYFAYRLTTDRGVGETKPTSAHRVHLQEIAYYATIGNASANRVQVWKVNGGTETQITAWPSVSAVPTSHDFASGEGKLTLEEGEDLVVVLLDDTSITDSADNYLTVVGELE